MKSLINKHHQAGLSLIELMVALVLSMLLMLGVTQIFLSSKVTYSKNQELSEIQESGRFALDILVQDIANAGYQGQCYRSEPRNSSCPMNQFPIEPGCLPRNHLEGGINGEIWTQSEGAILGWKGKLPAFIKAPAGSEGLFIELAAGGGRYSRTDDSPNDTDSKINLDQSFLGRIVLISNGKGCDLFKNVIDEDSVDSNYIKKNSSYNWSSNYEDELGFDKGFELLEFKSISYYVDKDKDSNISALYRANYNGGKYVDAEPLVPGVKNIELEYGVIKDRNEKVNKKGSNVLSIEEYIKADNEYFSSSDKWDDVAAVKVKLTIKAESGLEKNFSSVVVLRNRL